MIYSKRQKDFYFVWIWQSFFHGCRLSKVKIIMTFTIIKEESGSHFDHKLVEVFLRHKDEFLPNWKEAAVFARLFSWLRYYKRTVSLTADRYLPGEKPFLRFFRHYHMKLFCLPHRWTLLSDANCCSADQSPFLCLIWYLKSQIQAWLSLLQNPIRSLFFPAFLIIIYWICCQIMVSYFWQTDTIMTYII